MPRYPGLFRKLPYCQPAFLLLAGDKEQDFLDCFPRCLFVHGSPFRIPEQVPGGGRVFITRGGNGELLRAALLPVGRLNGDAIATGGGVDLFERSSHRTRIVKYYCSPVAKCTPLDLRIDGVSIAQHRD
jgi:hypothetical protein